MKKNIDRIFIILMYIRKLRILIRIFQTYKLALKVHEIYYNQTMKDDFNFSVCQRCKCFCQSINYKCTSRITKTHGQHRLCHHLQHMVRN